MAKGSAMEKPMKEPKVTMYSAVIAQVCLLLKISNCLATFSFMVPKAARRMMSKALAMSRGMASHMLIRPRPVGAGRYRYRPKIAGIKARV